MAPIIEKLGIDPQSKTAVWIQQQHDAGVKDADILTALTLSETIEPAQFKSVPLA